MKSILNRIITFILLFFLVLSCSDKGKADAYGNFETIETIVSAETNGKINFLNIEEGQELEVNYLVAVVDTSLLSQQKKMLMAKREMVIKKKPDVNSQIRVHQNQIATLQARLKSQDKEKNRIVNLLKGGAATQKQLDDINAEIDVTNTQIAVQKSQLIAQKIALLNQSNSISDEVSSIEEQIQQIKIQIGQAKIMNPIKGTVIDKYVEPNEVVNYGKPIYKIADLSNMILRAYVSGEQLGEVKIGQEVSLRIDAKDGDYKYYKGIVTWVSSKSEFTPKIIQTKKDRVNFVYAVKILVKNDGSLKMGMPAEILLEKASS